MRASPFLVLILGAALAACGEADEGPSETLRIEVVSAPTSGTAGWTLERPIVVRVVDEAGEPRPGVPVEWEATSYAAVTPGARASGVDGLITAAVTLGPLAGPQQVSARLGAGDAFRIPIDATVFRLDKVDADFGSACGMVRHEAWCWGVGDTPAPARRFAQLQVRDIAYDSGVLCILDEAGIPWCRSDWRGGDGERVVGAPPLRRIFAGSRFCGVAEADSAAWCWLRSPPVTSEPSVVGPAQRVPGSLRFRELAPRSAGACGIAADGSAWCWGPGSDGQLGDGSTTSSDVPVPVAGGLRFASITSSDRAGCGVSVGSVDVWCWGTIDLEHIRLVRSPPQLVPELRGSIVLLSNNQAITSHGAATQVWQSRGPSVLVQAAQGMHVGFREISLDGSVCGLTTDGSAYCSPLVFQLGTLPSSGPYYAGGIWLGVPRPEESTP